MACGSCGQNKSVEYEVRFSDGTTQRVSTTAEALTLMRGKPGSSYKAVPKVKV
jgi:hypothetical protein